MDEEEKKFTKKYLNNKDTLPEKISWDLIRMGGIFKNMFSRDERENYRRVCPVSKISGRPSMYVFGKSY